MFFQALSRSERLGKRLFIPCRKHCLAHGSAAQKASGWTTGPSGQLSASSRRKKAAVRIGFLFYGSGTGGAGKIKNSVPPWTLSLTGLITPHFADGCVHPVQAQLQDIPELRLRFCPYPRHSPPAEPLCKTKRLSHPLGKSLSHSIRVSDCWFFPLIHSAP